MNIDALSSEQLELVFYHALGFSDFSYCEKYKCWRVEKSEPDMRLTTVNIIADKNCKFSNSAYFARFRDEERYVLEMMKRENICLCWERDHKYPKLFYHAFPEITATDEKLQKAFKKVLVKSRIGDEISEELQEELNFDRIRTTNDPVFS